MVRDRFAPRAIVVAQKVQCSSQPSWILSQPRAFAGNRRSTGSTRGALNPAASSTRVGSAPPTTARTLGSAAIAPPSRAAAQPITTVSRRPPPPPPPPPPPGPRPPRPHLPPPPRVNLHEI